MNSQWRRTQLPQIVAALATRPGHENVRVQISEILHNAFAVACLALDQEVRLPEVHGRIDSLFGATVFEFKKDLRQELPDVQAKLPDYLGDRERAMRRRFLGIATDGATFLAYELRDGALAPVSSYITRPDRPDELLAWLEPALSNRDDLTPSPAVIQRELGRDSLTYGRARNLLERIWPGLLWLPAAPPRYSDRPDLGSGDSPGLRAASAAICPAKLVMNVLRLVSSDKSVKVPVVTASRGEAITAAVV
jgi:hypothetical protein